MKYHDQTTENLATLVFFFPLITVLYLENPKLFFKTVLNYKIYYKDNYKEDSHSQLHGLHGQVHFVIINGLILIHY